MSPAEQFRHLLAMAAADGRMNESELGFLSSRAVQLGVTDDQFESMLEQAIAGEVDLEIPTDQRERRRLLKDLIRMMAADGHLDQREKKLFAVVAASMQLSNDDLHQVIDATLAEGA